MALRQVRLWSGLSYRQLSGKANAAGDVLPPSTLASVLNRTALPKEEFVVALVRACGFGPETVAAWVLARKRLAMGEPVPEEEPATVEVRPVADVQAAPERVTAESSALTGRWPVVLALLGVIAVIAAASLILALGRDAAERVKP
ncbi:helix-turn-helix domain-containing protein [Kibdelosporangium persicum]|nr:helix-turn-helix transcriptional regulator [Kibdelosporangium persicum]